jgi:hypothetical protein
MFIGADSLIPFLKPQRGGIVSLRIFGRDYVAPMGLGEGCLEAGYYNHAIPNGIQGCWGVRTW